MIYFRFNCGKMWGLGHLYRNLSLMKVLKQRGYDCVAVINDDETANIMLSQNHIKAFQIKEYESAEELIKIISQNSSLLDAIVFWDRLDSEYNYMKKLIAAGVKVITYDNYHGSALYATEVIITRNVLINGSTVRYSGPKYQLLKEELKEYAIKEKVINPIAKKILLHFGGTDPLDILTKAFNALKMDKGYSFEFIAGKEEPNKLLKDEFVNYCNCTYLESLSDFPRYLYEADICLLSGGVSMYEAAAVGTPMILLSHNEDQNFAASIFEKEAGCINLGIASDVSDKSISLSVNQLAQDINLRMEMSRRLKAFVPYDGLTNVCDVVEDVIHRM